MTAPVFIKLNHNFEPPGVTIDYKPFDGATEFVPRDLAQAAVAAAYEAAAQVAIDRKGFGSDAALVHPYDKGYVAACDAITTAIRALATPDQTAALAAKVDASQAPNPAVNGGSCQSDPITLPRAEVEALMEAASDAASELASIRHHIAAAIVKKALATLQERMK